MGFGAYEEDDQEQYELDMGDDDEELETEDRFQGEMNFEHGSIDEMIENMDDSE